ncbi:MAG TPA: 2-phosphosulfolactate phosphatase [Candidatus Limnocylindrales bacterium]
MTPTPDDRLTDSLDQHGFGARLEWGQAGVRRLAPLVDVVVIVDVLSFTTAVSVAVEHGAAVFPHRFRDATAAERARSVGARLAQARQDGPGPSLSPASLTALMPGDRLLLPSPNGATCAVLAAEAGATVVAGCMRNASAVARLVRERGRTVAVIPAGEQWPDGTLRPGIEDLLGAGAILAALAAEGGDRWGSGAASPEARLAVAAFERLRPDLARVLEACASGRELIDRGFSRDVDLAADLDATDLVPVLRDGAFAAA